MKLLRKCIMIIVCAAMITGLMAGVVFADDGQSSSGTCGENLTWELSADGTLSISGSGAMDDYLNWHDPSPWYDQRNKITSVVIGDGVTSIGDSAFYMTTVSDVTISDSVERIGEMAFAECSQLISIVIPDSVTYIGESAFVNCIWLESVVLPSNIAKLKGNMFIRCYELKNVSIPSSVTSIGRQVFAYNGFTSINIPKNVTNIGPGAFFRCRNLTDIYYGGSEDDWNSIGIGENNELDNVTIHYAGWQKISGCWYYIDESGHFLTGWQKLGGTWYYMNDAGIMLTGWQKVNGTWYYFKGSGAMVTGWQKIDGIWYYFTGGGAMVTGWQKIGSTWYFFKSSGAMAANEWCSGYWLNKDGSWTYQPRGSWHQNSKGWWFGDTSGWYAKNTTIKIDNKYYTFDAAGYWVK